MQEKEITKSLECMRIAGSLEEIRRLTIGQSGEALRKCMAENPNFFTLLPTNYNISKEHLKIFLNQCWCFEFSNTKPPHEILGYGWVITDYSVVLITAIHIRNKQNEEMLYSRFVQAMVSWPYITEPLPSIADKSFLAVTPYASLLTASGFTNEAKDIRPEGRESAVLILDRAKDKIPENIKAPKGASVKSQFDIGQLEEASDLLMTQTHWGSKITPSVLKTYHEKSISYILEAGKKVIGFGRIVTDGIQIITILDFVIAKEYRGQGYGSYLLDRMLKDTRISHIPCWRLTSSQAPEFYSKMGFKLSNLAELPFGKVLRRLTLEPVEKPHDYNSLTISKMGLLAHTKISGLPAAVSAQESKASDTHNNSLPKS